MSTKKRLVKNLMLCIIGLIIIAAILFYFFESTFIRKELPKPININTTDQPTLGDAKAKVHIVAFEDLKCSNCARFNVEMMPYLEKKFINTGIAKYTMMNVAFIPGSMPAANAARCVYEQNTTLFFDYTHYIFTHQPPEDQNWATVPNLLNYANDVKGIDTNKLAQCLVKSPYDHIMQSNLALAKKIMPDGIVSTPTLYVNGIIVRPLTKTQLNKVISAVR